MLRTPAWARTWSILRLVMAVAITAAIVGQLVESLSRAAGRGDDVATVAANFFSFFTILSNAIAVVVLVLVATWSLTRGRDAAAPIEPRGLAIALASVSTYMIITGIVYNILLRGVQLYPGTEPVWWSNEILHLVAPLFLLLDVLLAPNRRALAWSTVGIIAIFPIAWVIYTLIRGPLVTNPNTDQAWWYPYPFLDPNNFDNGFGTVALYIVGIAVGIVAVGLLVVWVGRRRGARSSDQDAATPAS